MESRLPCGLKLKSGGNGRPLGKRQLGSRSSSKKGCTQASNCIQPNKIKRKLAPVRTKGLQYKLATILELQYQSTLTWSAWYDNSAPFHTRDIHFPSTGKVKSVRKSQDRKQTALQRRFGEYWRSLETKSTASGGIRLWNTCVVDHRIEISIQYSAMIWMAWRSRTEIQSVRN
jgi:hypothetical protein